MRPSHLNIYLKGHTDIHATSLVRILSELGIDLEALVERELAKARGEELLNHLSPGDTLELIMNKMDREERHAMLSYASRFARVALGRRSESAVRHLKDFASW